MKLTINKQEREFASDAICLQEVIAACGFPPTGIAVAIDNRVIRRSDWANTIVSDGATLTVIRAVCGG